MNYNKHFIRTDFRKISRRRPDDFQTSVRGINFHFYYLNTGQLLPKTGGNFGEIIELRNVLLPFKDKILLRDY